MVLKLREKGWIVILRQVIPTSPLSLYGMERFRVRNFLVLFSRLGCTLNFPEVRNGFKIERERVDCNFQDLMAIHILK
jgi:hypothetical protein